MEHGSAHGKGLDRLPACLRMRRRDRSLRSAVAKFDDHFPRDVLRRLHRAPRHSIEPSILLCDVCRARVVPPQHRAGQTHQREHAHAHPARSIEGSTDRLARACLARHIPPPGM